MGVNEDDVMNIMGGMEHAGGIKLNDHKRKLKNRYRLLITILDPICNANFQNTFINSQ